MKNIKTAFLLGIVLFILSGCGNKITSGKVYEKEFIPAHEETQLMPIISSNGKTTKTILIPQTRNVPDKWYIKIQSEKPDEDGKYQKETYCVSEDIFNQYEVGDFYSHEN